MAVKSTMTEKYNFAKAWIRAANNLLQAAQTGTGTTAVTRISGNTGNFSSGSPTTEAAFLLTMII
jgi:hypothetical protein